MNDTETEVKNKLIELGIDPDKLSRRELILYMLVYNAGAQAGNREVMDMFNKIYGKK